MDLPLVGAHQLGLEGAETEAEIELRTRHMIARALNIRRMVGFVGSGISLAYGYPSWDHFFRSLITFTLGKLGASLSADNSSLLTQSLGAQVPGQPSEGADHKLLALGVCEESFRSAGRIDEWRKHAASLIPKRGKLSPGGPDPMRIILERLQIRRFMTINYDSVIEDSLQRVLGCRIMSASTDAEAGSARLSKWSASSLATEARSLSFDPTRPNDLVQFATGAPGFECGVFHCHGVATDPSSMILSERDYQRLYLRDDPAHESYRDALDLALGSNPVMFLGVGMDEADLLRPLRQFASQQHREIRERPLFALLPRPSDAVAAITLRKRLLIRFGVKALFYNHDTGDMTVSLCNALEQMAKYWREWWFGWQRKPMPRKPDFHQPRPNVMIHHFSDPPHKLSVANDHDALVTDALTRKKAVLVVGLPGAGKGGLGFRLALDDQFGSKFVRRFYASTHFTNEVLSIVDGAANFLGGGKKIEGAPLDRLCRVLQAEPHLLIIGGLERLLTPVLSTDSVNAARATNLRDWDHRIPWGRPLNRHVKQVLECLDAVAQSGKSRIVFTTSVLPVGVHLPNCESVLVRGVSTDAVIALGKFEKLGNHAILDALCCALNGHVYALSVVASAIGKMSRDDAIAWIMDLVTAITAVDLARRAEIAIAKAISALHARAAASVSAVNAVLYHVALFTTPVSAEAIRRSLDANHVGADVVRSAIDVLHDAGLVLCLPSRLGARHARYTAHTVVRTHVLHNLGHLPDVPAEPQRLEHSGFSTESEELQTSTRASQDIIASGVDSVLDAIETFQSTDVGPRRELIRAAFGLMRSQWTATSIGRRAHLQMEESGSGLRSHYDAYLRRLSRLTNAVRKAQTAGMLLGENVVPDDGCESVDAMLYADELTWLYNELGMVSYCKGSLYDAYGLLRITEDLCVVAERGRRGRRWCQSEINRGLVDVDGARISRARLHFENASAEARVLDDSETEACAQGFLGLVRHLAGDFQPALSLYSHAIEKLATIENRRALSILHRHRADLNRRFGDLGDAQRDLRLCMTYAESGRHPDLVHYARIAQANLALLTGDLNSERGGHELLEPTLEFARVVGIPRLEADALKVQAHIALGRGNTILSRKLALAVMQVAVGNGMRLRSTAALCLIGCVDRVRGNWEGARRLLLSAVEHAQRQGYYLMVQDAEHELLRIAAWDQSYPGPKRGAPARKNS